MTRKTDSTVSVSDRARVAKGEIKDAYWLAFPKNGDGTKDGVDFFFSIHCNSNGTTSKGTLALVWDAVNDQTPSNRNTNDYKFAKNVVKDYVDSTKKVYTGASIRTSQYPPDGVGGRNNLTILTNTNIYNKTSYGFPRFVTLLETEFASNPTTWAWLQNESYQDKAVAGMAEGIKKTKQIATGIEDYIWISVNYPDIPFNLNQIYLNRVSATFVDIYPYGDSIVSWGNWKVKALTTNGDAILVYESPTSSSFIKIPTLPVYNWDRNANNYVKAKIGTSGIDNRGIYHENYTDILINDIPSVIIQPIISNFTQTPNPLYRDNSGSVTCNLSQGNGNLNFYWSIVSGNTGFSISNVNSQTVSIHYSNTYAIEKTKSGNISSSKEIPIERPTGAILKCKVWNSAGIDSANVFINLATTQHGCPFVYTWNGEVWVEDNNILPQSQDPDLLGQDVTDFYQLYTKPILDEGKYYLAVGEFEDEISYLDQLKLLVIDHPQETFITVDDEGEIIQFAKPAYFANAQLDSIDIKKIKFYNNLVPMQNNSKEKFSVSFGLGIKYFISKPEGKYYEDDPIYKTNYAVMLNLELPFSSSGRHYFITELKYYRSPIHPYGNDYDIYFITLYYKYRLKLFEEIYPFFQIGYNIYSNKQKSYFFSNAIDFGVEYSTSTLNLFLKNSINYNIFSGASLPFFIFSGIKFKL